VETKETFNNAANSVTLCVDAKVENGGESQKNPENPEPKAESASVPPKKEVKKHN
jgi:hypothetical protein